MSRTPQNPEHIEKIRQEIMRFRELLDLMRERMDMGDRMYTRLFASLTDEEKQGKREKDLQTLVAWQLEHDQSALEDAVSRMRFAAREFEKAFEELHDKILTPPLMDED